MDLTSLYIAIVDDHELFSLGIRALIAEFIPKEKILIMNNGQEFVEYLQEGHSVNLLLVDLQMPVMDGKELIKRLKQQSSPPKIIVISMHNDSYIIEECKSLGADGFIKKDSSSKTLKEGITQVMAGNSYFPTRISTAGNSLPPIAKEFGLTKREIEIIKLIKNNYSSQQISDILHISLGTVKTHRKNINNKLDINNVVALMDFAHRHKL